MVLSAGRNALTRRAPPNRVGTCTSAGNQLNSNNSDRLDSADLRGPFNPAN
jgi:hypothetical protein